jgi:hypothetical protein
MVMERRVCIARNMAMKSEVYISRSVFIDSFYRDRITFMERGVYIT